VANKSSSWTNPDTATEETPDFNIQDGYSQNTPDESLGVQVVALGEGNLMPIF
jgi:hypothetical protein